MTLGKRWGIRARGEVDARNAGDSSAAVASEPVSHMSCGSRNVPRTWRSFGSAICGAILAISLASSSAHRATAQEAPEPEPVPVPPAVATVTVINLAKGQILTPAVFYTHNPEAPPLFVPGEPASLELASLAETGSTGGLMNRLRAEGPTVLSVERLSRFIRPGNSASIDIRFDADHRLVSSASMIEMTNDGFISLVSAEIPCAGVKTYLLEGWDAGSEANSELCAHVPAPCPTPRRSGACSVRGREGFVHVHGGVHGCGGFPPEIYDWRNPIAKITIEVAKDRSPAGSLAAACPVSGTD